MPKRKARERCRAHLKTTRPFGRDAPEGPSYVLTSASVTVSSADSLHFSADRGPQTVEFSRSERLIQVQVILVAISLLGPWGCERSDSRHFPQELETSAITCPKTVEALVNRDRPRFRISYQEPTKKLDGSPLTNLAKTTIYYNLDHRTVKAAEVPASRPTGGGYVSGEITVPIRDNQDIFVAVCATATDADGNEGPPTE